MDFTSPYLDIPMVIVTKVDKHFIDGIKGILDKKIAIVKDYSISNILKEKYPNINIVEVDSIYDGLKDVESGAVFAFIDNLATANYELQRSFMDILKVSGRLETRLKYRIATRNDEPILKDIFEKVIMSIDRTTKDKIFHKWVNPPKKDTVIDYSLMWKLFALFLLILTIATIFMIILRRNNKNLTKYLNSTIDAMAIFKDGKLIDVNQVALDMYGYSSLKKIKGKSALFFVQSSQHDLVKQQLSLMNVKSYELNMIKKDKTIFPVLVKGTQISKRIRVSSIIDLTELKSAYNKLEYLNKNLLNEIDNKVNEIRQKEQQLLNQSRLAQMGEMISMIAHQWRQPLTTISVTSASINLKALLDTLDNDTAIELSNNIIDYTQHLSATIDDFREFFKPNKEKADTSFNELIEAVLNIVEITIVNNNIKLIKDFNCKNILHTYPNEIRQVILNLIKNAEDVLLDKGISNPTITIETVDSTLIIRDNAGGVPEDIIDKIFEPYFSTKTKKDGTGLGLYMSKTIIQEHCDGKLTVSNDEDGAVFKIDLRKKP